jgi:hypothetical protein
MMTSQAQWLNGWNRPNGAAPRFMSDKHARLATARVEEPMAQDPLLSMKSTDLANALRDAEPLLMRFDGIAALNLLGALQLVLRNPEYRCTLAAERIYRIARALEAHLVEYAPESAEVIRKGWGWDRHCDR